MNLTTCVIHRSVYQLYMKFFVLNMQCVVQSSTKHTKEMIEKILNCFIATKTATLTFWY